MTNGGKIHMQSDTMGTSSTRSKYKVAQINWTEGFWFNVVKHQQQRKLTILSEVNVSD